MLIAIDPGVQKSGIAHFESGSLVSVFYTDWSDLNPSLINYNDQLVIEMPRVYPGSGQQKGDLNDLLNLAAIVGRYECVFSNHIRVFPAQWKGQVPKKIMNKRVCSKLSAAELAVLNAAWVGPASKLHNVLDAVGIGLHFLGRL